MDVTAVIIASIAAIPPTVVALVGLFMAMRYGKTLSQVHELVNSSYGASLHTTAILSREKAEKTQPRDQVLFDAAAAAERAYDEHMLKQMNADRSR